MYVDAIICISVKTLGYSLLFSNYYNIWTTSYCHITGRLLFSSTWKVKYHLYFSRKKITSGNKTCYGQMWCVITPFHLWRAFFVRLETELLSGFLQKYHPSAHAGLVKYLTSCCPVNLFSLHWGNGHVFSSFEICSFVCILQLHVNFELTFYLKGSLRKHHLFLQCLPNAAPMTVVGVMNE